MEFNSFKEAIIARCKELGVTEYELYYQAGASTSVDTFQHSINEFKSSMGGGVCFRAIVGGKMGYASTEALNEATAASVVEQAADNASVLEAEEQVDHVVFNVLADAFAEFLDQTFPHFRRLDFIPFVCVQDPGSKVQDHQDQREDENPCSGSKIYIFDDIFRVHLIASLISCFTSAMITP